MNEYRLTLKELQQFAAIKAEADRLTRMDNPVMFGLQRAKREVDLFLLGFRRIT